MRVVVTGAAGFVGSHVCERLVALGHEVAGVDDFDPLLYGRARKEGNVAALHREPAFALREADVRDRAALGRVLAGADAVVHLAARAGVRASHADPRAWEAVNVAGTAAVLKEARRAGVARLVFASSSSVYGAGAVAPFREDAKLGRPQSPYAATKAAGERLCRRAARGFDSLAVLRLFTVYGPRQRPDLALHRFAERMLAGEPLELYGSDRTYRDYTHVADTAGAIAAALERERGAVTVNVASGRPILLGDAVDALEAALGVRARRRVVAAPAGEAFGTWADVSRAREVLGFQPRWSFEDGVADYAAWLGALRRAA